METIPYRRDADIAGTTGPALAAPRSRRAAATCRLALLLIAAVALTAGCSSRYGSSIALISGEKRAEAPVEQTRYMVYTDLADPYADQKTKPGPGRVVLVTMAMWGRTFESDFMPGFSFDEQQRYRLYLALPPGEAPAETDLAGNSFLEFSSRYDYDASERLFLPREGRLSADSTRDEYLYLSVSGAYRNGSGRELSLDGHLRVKISE